MNEKVIEKFIKKHGDRYVYNLVDYKNAITKVSIICKKHGLFKITPNSHLNGSGCYDCGREKVNISRLTSNEDFINKCKIIHNDIYDYSKVDYKGIKEYIIINCKKHGDFKQKATKHLQGQGCKKCSNERMFVDFKKMCFEKYTEYKYDKMIYNGMYKKVIITCNEHGDFEKTPIDFYHKDRICPKCVNRCKSNDETKWLDELNVPIDKRNIYIKFGNKTFCVDGVDHDNKIIYEFYGDFFHGNPSVYKKDDINPLLKETYGSLYNKTINKEKIILNSGYKLKTIWESEYRKNNKYEKIPGTTRVVR